MVANNKQAIFSKLPQGFPVEGETMAINSSTIDLHADIPDGSIFVKMLCLSVDPYMRENMRDPSIKSYLAAFEIGEPLYSNSMAKILKSRNNQFAVDDVLYGILPFQEYALLSEKDTANVEVRNECRTLEFPITNYIGVLGMPEMTAYVGLIKFGKPKKGETLYASAASGAVGQLVGQIGKILGLRVVGSAGSDEKVAYLKEIGCDAAFNYKTQDLDHAFTELCPDGIDIYFENVGGKILEPVIDHANQFARIICCGMISQYNSRNDEPFRKYVTSWLQNGDINYCETIAEGIEATPKALTDVLIGKNFGKQVVKVAEL